MKIALSLLNRVGKKQAPKEDRFDARLKTMTSPAVTGPRLRRTPPPVLFAFRTRGAA